MSDSESKACPNKPGCPLYPRFTSKVVLRIYMSRYCDGTYQQCARYCLSSSGERVDPDLLPDGDYLDAVEAG